MAAPPLVSLDGVSLSYAGHGGGRVPALRDVRLTVHPGEWVTVLGPNAAGKSSLVRIVAGVVAPEAGSVTLPPGDAHAVGVLLPDPDAQLVAQTVEEEVAFGLENLGLPSAEIGRRIERVLGTLGIASLRARESGTLSGGEKQLVLLASVLAMEPALLLLDEPSLMLDHAAWGRVLAGIEEANRLGTAVLLTGNDPDQVPPRGRTLLLAGGRLAGDGGAIPAAQLVAAGLRAPMGPGEGRRPAAPRTVAPSAAGARPPVSLRGAGVAPPGGGRDLLAGIDLVLHPGETLLVTGPSGAGKTTLARLLAGLVGPGAGTVDREPVAVGLAFQFPEDQFLRERVGEEVAVDCPDEGRMRGAFADLGLDWAGLRDRPLDSLSTGQRRLVALAGILAAARPVVILDEPTAGLDGGHRDLLAAFVDRRRDGGGTTVVIGHDLRTFLPGADRVLALEGGRVAFLGTPGEFLDAADRWSWVPPAFRSAGS